VKGGATLELKMDIYDNSAGEDINGKCCDLFCTSACDHFFSFSIDAPDGRQATYNDAKQGSFFTRKTTFIQDQNVDYFTKDIGGMNNPIAQYFTSWPGAVLFKVFIQDDDINAPDDVDAIITRLTLIPQGTAGTAQWQNMLVRGMRKEDPTSLNFDYRLYCELNYYGPSCTKQCIASDSDTEGHFTCDPTTGNIVCLPGYENTDRNCLVKTNQCMGNRCKNNGTCVTAGDTYTCSCAPGSAGTFCEAQVVGPCPDGYVGQSCDVRLCDFITCQNGGSCVNGLCQCRQGYSGSKCESANLCSTKPCQNDGTCYTIPYRCDCLPGYEGDNCQVTSLNITAGRYAGDPTAATSITDAFGSSQPKALLIALIVIAFVLLVLTIVLLGLLLCYRRRALKAEKECIMLSHGASSSILEKSTTNNNNTYQSSRFHTLLSSSSSCNTDATSCSSPSSPGSAEPDYADLTDSQLQRADYAYTNNAMQVKPDAPPKRSHKVDGLKGDGMAGDRKSKC